MPFFKKNENLVFVFFNIGQKAWPHGLASVPNQRGSEFETSQNRKVVKRMVSSLRERKKLLYCIIFERNYYFGRQKQLRGNNLCKSLGSFLPERTLCIVDLNRNLLANQ
jgi:hypothetical protein